MFNTIIENSLMWLFFFQIEKNKNVQIKRKKEDRNPRVKLRKKFRKAKIRRKGQVIFFTPHTKFANQIVCWFCIRKLWHIVHID